LLNIILILDTFNLTSASREDAYAGLHKFPLSSGE